MPSGSARRRISPLTMQYVPPVEVPREAVQFYESDPTAILRAVSNRPPTTTSFYLEVHASSISPTMYDVVSRVYHNDKQYELQESFERSLVENEFDMLWEIMRNKFKNAIKQELISQKTIKDLPPPKTETPNERPQENQTPSA